MRRRELMKKVKQYAKDNNLEVTVEEGGSHTKVTLGTEGRSVVPRHNEINEITARSILKQLGME